MNLRKVSVGSASSKRSVTDERPASLKRKRPRLTHEKEEEPDISPDAQTIDGTGTVGNLTDSTVIESCPRSVREAGMKDDSPNDLCIATPYIDRYCHINMGHSGTSNDTKMNLSLYTPQLITPDAHRYKNSSNDFLLQSKVDGLLSDLKKDATASPILSPRFEPAFRLMARDDEDADDPFSQSMTSPAQNAPEITKSKTPFQPKSDNNLLPPWSPLFDTPEKFIPMEKSLQQVDLHSDSSCLVESSENHNDRYSFSLQSRPEFSQARTQDTIPTSEFAGFRTAKGKEVQVTESLLEQAKQKFLREEGSEIDSKLPKLVETPDKEDFSKTSSIPRLEHTPIGASETYPIVMGFTSARGKSITIAEERLSWAKGFLEGGLHDGQPCDLSTSPQYSSQTTDVKNLNLSSVTQEINITKWNDSQVSSGMGFHSAKGKAIAVDTCKMKWAKEFLDDHSGKLPMPKASLPELSNHQVQISPSPNSPQERSLCAGEERDHLDRWQVSHNKRDMTLLESPVFSSNRPPVVISSVVPGKSRNEHDSKFIQTFSRTPSPNLLSTNIRGKIIPRSGFKSPSRLTSPPARTTSSMTNKRDTPSRSGWTSSGKSDANVANRARKPYRLNGLAKGIELFSGFSDASSLIDG